MLPSAVGRIKKMAFANEKKQHSKWKQSKDTKYWKYTISVHLACCLIHFVQNVSCSFPISFPVLHFKILLSIPSTTGTWVTCRLRPAGVKRTAVHANWQKPAHSRYSGEFSTENKERWPFCFGISLGICIFSSSARKSLVKTNWQLR